MGKRLYVGNLSYNVTEEALTELFSQCGTVESSKILFDREKGRSKGFGFVEMSTDDEAAQAIEKFNGSDYNGRPLTVNEAKPMAPRNDRHGGGGNRFGGGGGGGRNKFRGGHDRGGY